MKRFIAVVAGVLALPAFAEVAPLYFEEFTDIEETAAAEVPGDESAKQVIVQMPQAPQAGRAGARGRVTTRNSSTTGRAATNGRAAVVSRATRAGVVGRTPANTVARSGSAGSGVALSARPSRNSTDGAGQIATTRRKMQNGSGTIARAAVTTNDTVNNPIYTGNVAARASVRSSSRGSVRARIPTISASVESTSVSSVSTPTTAASVAATMDELAQITAFCKAQYTECMDNFCNVLDDNQGRCSCSKNIKNYEKTEIALKEATEALQDVAQQIQYIGLTGDEIETLFTQTEAEAAMSANTDNTQLKNDLDKIKGLLVGVKSGTASSTEVSDGLSMDLSGLMNFNIDSTGFNLGALFGTTTTSNTSSISNQRGEQLYKTAAARCKSAVLMDCQSQGVDISVVSNSYDLEIDKQCVAYERALTDANDEMNQTVRNAKSVLQRARLMVAQQKNSYDLRGCVNALDSCMQDDFVCGNEYESCLDPFGKYIVDGEVVLGSAPGQDSFSGTVTAPQYSSAGLYSTWNFGTSNNAWGDNSKDSLTEYINQTLPNSPTEYQKVTDTNMSKYLQHKIGYHEATTNKNHGMCMSVLNKCQDYTYVDGVYQANNPVVREYLSRTLVQIKAKQDQIISDYAESCITDVQSCLAENNYESKDSPKSRIAINACRSQIITCMSVNGDPTQNPTPSGMAAWVENVMPNADSSN